MKLLPSLVRLKIQGKSNISLWIPLFLLWPLLLVLAIFLAPFILVASLILLKGNIIKSLLLFPAFYELLADLKGLDIDINNPNENISIYIK